MNNQEIYNLSILLDFESEKYPCYNGTNYSSMVPQCTEEDFYYFKEILNDIKCKEFIKGFLKSKCISSYFSNYNYNFDDDLICE